MSTQFFFDRMQRAIQMDMANEIQGKDCAHIFEATNWLEAYKSSLSSNKLKDFLKEWKKCEAELAATRKQSDFGKK